MHRETRDAKIILPTHDNDGVPLDFVRGALETVLLDNFGGFSSYEGTGAWRDDNGKVYKEPHWAFEVAFARDAKKVADLVNIARWLANAARQDCIYLKTPDGLVHFINHTHIWKVA